MALTALATYDDLLARWTASTTPTEEQAEAALLDASVFVLAYLGGLYDAGNLTDVQEGALTLVTCSVAIRSLSATASGAGYGVTQYSQTASSFTEQLTYSNPTGDLYLTSAEKKMLAGAFGQFPYYTVPCFIDYEGAR